MTATLRRIGRQRHYRARLLDEDRGPQRRRRASSGSATSGFRWRSSSREAGFRVVGYDVSSAWSIGSMPGESHIQDVPSADVGALVKAGRFVATTRPGADRPRSDAVSIAVPTPLVKTRDPDMSYRRQGDRDDRRALSTRHARRAREHDVSRARRASWCSPKSSSGAGSRSGEDVFLAFSPERVDPGNPRTTRRTRPRWSAGSRRRALEVAAALYGTCIDTVVPVSSPEAAELVKLLENTFRSVNIGLVNEMAIMCDRLGVNVWEVIDAAATKPFGFMKFTPGPGIGGHCIPLDPHYLAWKMRTLNYRTRFIDLASEINSQMPDFVVARRWRTR